MHELAGLVGSVHRSLVGLGSATVSTPSSELESKIRLPTPAQVRGSVTNAGLVSFVDGRSYQTLKRHLSAHGLTPATYRQRYGLATDYPMVAPDYSAKRSALAKDIGLGRIGTTQGADTAPKNPARRKST